MLYWKRNNVLIAIFIILVNAVIFIHNVKSKTFSDMNYQVSKFILSQYSHNTTREETGNIKLNTRTVTYRNHFCEELHRINTISQQNILILSLIGSQKSYGVERSFQSFFYGVLSNLSYPIENISIGLLIPDLEEFERVDHFVAQYYNSNETNEYSKFSSIKLVNANFLEDSSLDRNNRHDPTFQSKRRSVLAKSRNYLFTSTTENEDYVLWIDNDISSLPPNLIEIFLEHDKDITTIRIVDQDSNDYDLNSWNGPRKVPSERQLERIKDKKSNNYHYIPKDVKTKTKHLRDYLGEPDGKHGVSIKLNSVGSAVLFVKAEIHRQGILFSPFYIIGIKDWDFWDGYDGIESESLCFQAEKIGYQCYGLPQITAFHSS